MDPVGAPLRAGEGLGFRVWGWEDSGLRFGTSRFVALQGWVQARGTIQGLWFSQGCGISEAWGVGRIVMFVLTCEACEVPQCHTREPLKEDRAEVKKMKNMEKAIYRDVGYEHEAWDLGLWCCGFWVWGLGFRVWGLAVPLNGWIRRRSCLP